MFSNVKSKLVLYLHNYWDFKDSWMFSVSKSLYYTNLLIANTAWKIYLYRKKYFFLSLTYKLQKYIPTRSICQKIIKNCNWPWREIKRKDTELGATPWADLHQTWDSWRRNSFWNKNSKWWIPKYCHCSGFLRYILLIFPIFFTFTY